MFKRCCGIIINGKFKQREWKRLNSIQLPGLSMLKARFALQELWREIKMLNAFKLNKNK